MTGRGRTGARGSRNASRGRGRGGVRTRTPPYLAEYRSLRERRENEYEVQTVERERLRQERAMEENRKRSERIKNRSQEKETDRKAKQKQGARGKIASAPTYRNLYPNIGGEERPTQGEGEEEMQFGNQGTEIAGPQADMRIAHRGNQGVGAAQEDHPGEAIRNDQGDKENGVPPIHRQAADQLKPAPNYQQLDQPALRNHEQQANQPQRGGAAARAARVVTPREDGGSRRQDHHGNHRNPEIAKQWGEDEQRREVQAGEAEENRHDNEDQQDLHDNGARHNPMPQRELALQGLELDLQVRQILEAGVDQPGRDVQTNLELPGDGQLPQNIRIEEGHDQPQPRNRNEAIPLHDRIYHQRQLNRTTTSPDQHALEKDNNVETVNEENMRIDAVENNGRISPVDRQL